MNYELQYITIKCQCAGGQSTMYAHVANGLAYHLTHHGKDRNGPHWTVTHIQSGYTLCTETLDFKSSDQCQSFITRVGGFCDWTVEKPTPSEDMKQAVRRIALECQAQAIYTPVF